MPTLPVELIRIRSEPAVLAASVSAAGNHSPVSAVPVVDTMAGSAAVPEATVVMPVADSEVNSPVLGVVAPMGEGDASSIACVTYLVVPLAAIVVSDTSTMGIRSLTAGAVIAVSAEIFVSAIILSFGLNLTVVFQQNYACVFHQYANWWSQTNRFQRWGQLYHAKSES